MRKLLLPFSLLYGLITALRNKCYDAGLLKSHRFPFPVIVVGNLSLGGTGKSPHVEYLLRLLTPSFRVATLSRGYGRKTTGFMEVTSQSTAAEVGDEPLQFRKKNDTAKVFVDEHRVHGIKTIKEKHPNTQVILLDDAFQHRKVKPGLAILLTQWGSLYANDLLLPAGNLRESAGGAKRADIIIVTKCPSSTITADERRRVKQQLKVLSHQRLFFSFLNYQSPVALNNATQTIALNKTQTVILLTGIANAALLKKKLTDDVKEVIHIEFQDHYHYTVNDIRKIKKSYENIGNENKLIITTMKDAVKLTTGELHQEFHTLPVYYMPVEVAFCDADGEEFNQLVQNSIENPEN